MKILIFGISGLIGNSLFRYLSKNKELKVFGTSRRGVNLDNKENIIYFNCNDKNRLLNLNSIISKSQPDLIINSLGITKHIQVNNESQFNDLNSNFPHEIAKVSNNLNIKFLQISTDCVFLGTKGNYDELSACDSKDLYGISKFEGEVVDKYNLTIRISTIGREMGTKNGLLEWFLTQEKKCFGYKNAFFSGITTYELSNVISNYILPNINKLHGLYHISGEKINKYDLLNKFNKTYNSNIEIIPEIDFQIDRSLNCKKFNSITGYVSKSWDDMLNNKYI